MKPTSLARGAAAALLGGLVVLGACEGGNIFGIDRSTDQGNQQAGDKAAPTVDIRRPAANATFPLGDSVLVEVQVKDNAGVREVTFGGVSFRGNRDLGTDIVVTRFNSKTVTFARGAKDTVITRYVSATPDNVSERVSIFVTAKDSTGNTGVDTVQVVVGGPRVEIRAPDSNQQVQAGRTLGVRIFATDPAQIRQVKLNATGILTDSIVLNFTPARDTVLVDTAISLPAGVTGTLNLRASARSSLDVVGQSDVRTLTVATTTTADTARPSVSLSASAASRAELTDSLRVSVSARDNNGGSGLVRVGVTALAINTGRPDTAVVFTQVYSPPRTGSVVREFAISPAFAVDSLALPDTVVFQLHAFAVDSAGNCAAATTGTEQRLVCDTSRVVGGQRLTLASGVTGSRAEVVAVAGRTASLPDRGTIADAVVDTGRARLYLSNFSNQKVDLLNLADMTFLEPGVLVGSEPWGMFLNVREDTLFVANSGGTNISFVSLGGSPAEDRNRRLLTPNASLFTVSTTVGSTGREQITRTVIDFSDRPQFIVQDSTRRLLYSTVPTGAASTGTIRYVIADPVPSATDDRPEVRILFSDDAVVAAEDVFAVAHVDSVNPIPNDAGDRVEIFDHLPGYPDQIIRSGALRIAAAIDTIRARGSDIYAKSGNWDLAAVGMSDTTFLAASGDRGFVAFGEGATAPFGRIILWNAATASISDEVQIQDLIGNAAEQVLGVGLNLNGSLGVFRGGAVASFFSNDLRLQGRLQESLGSGGAGAALHPNHTSIFADTSISIAFVGTGRQSVKIVDTFNFFTRGELHIRDNVTGPLRISLPLAGDNAGRSCPGDPLCVVARLYGVTSGGGVVVVNVRRKDYR